MPTLKIIKPGGGGDYVSLAAAVVGEAATTGELVLECYAGDVGGVNVNVEPYGEPGAPWYLPADGPLACSSLTITVHPSARWTTGKPRSQVAHATDMIRVGNSGYSGGPSLVSRTVEYLLCAGGPRASIYLGGIPDGSQNQHTATVRGCRIETPWAEALVVGTNYRTQPFGSFTEETYRQDVLVEDTIIRALAGCTNPISQDLDDNANGSAPMLTAFWVVRNVTVVADAPHHVLDLLRDGSGTYCVASVLNSVFLAAAPTGDVIANQGGNETDFEGCDFVATSDGSATITGAPTALVDVPLSALVGLRPRPNGPLVAGMLTPGRAADVLGTVLPYRGMAPVGALACLGPRTRRRRGGLCHV